MTWWSESPIAAPLTFRALNNLEFFNRRLSSMSFTIESHTTSYNATFVWYCFFCAVLVCTVCCFINWMFSELHFFNFYQNILLLIFTIHFKLRDSKTLFIVGVFFGAWYLKHSHANYVITNIWSLQHKQQILKFSHS